MQPGLDDLTRHYECLRGIALNDRRREDQGLGLALFLRVGMTAWMQTWARISPLPRSAAPASDACGQSLGAHRQRDLINILVAMILDHRKEKQA